MEKSLTDGAKQLHRLSKLLKHVYQPLENSTDLISTMSNMSRQINQSLQKIYLKTVSIEIPEIPEDKSDEDLIKDPKVRGQLEIIVLHSYIIYIYIYIYI